MEPSDEFLYLVGREEDYYLKGLGTPGSDRPIIEIAVQSTYAHRGESGKNMVFQIKYAPKETIVRRKLPNHSGPSEYFTAILSPETRYDLGVGLIRTTLGKDLSDHQIAQLVTDIQGELNG